MLRSSISARARAALLALAVGLAPTACKDGPNDLPTPEYSLAIADGTARTAPAGTRVGTPLQVTVRATSGETVQGAVVQFRVLAGGDAVLDDSAAVSGIDGVAMMGVRAGATFPGTAQVRAFVRGQEEKAVVFSITTAAPPTVTAVSPAALRSGDTVDVKGASFGSAIASRRVLFGTTRGVVVGTSGDTLLRVIVPPCLATGPVSVRVEVDAAAATFNGASYTATALRPLQGFVASGGDVAGCLPGGGAQYVLVPQFPSTKDSVPEAISYTVSASPGPVIAAALAEGDAQAGAAGSRAQLAFDLRMREVERRIAPDVARDAPAIRDESAARLEALELGSTRKFQVLSSLEGDITFKSNTAVLKYIGSHTLLYYDREAPDGAAGGFSDAQLAAFGKVFDETLYRIGVEKFGSESDIDRNGKVIVLMSSVVNELSPSCALGSVIGFFYPNDFTNARGSNKGEILYTLVPDPTGKWSCAHTANEVLSITPSTMLHEFQHMISHNQHVIVRKAEPENVWLNEGLSILAEELGSRHYEDRCPPPACRSSGAGQLFPDSSQGYILNLLTNAYSWLNLPQNSSVTAFGRFGTLAERGGAWLFVRWLVDQKGEQVIPRLVQTSRTSLANVEFAAGEPFPALFGDFGIAVYTDSLPGVPRAAVPERYRFKSRNLRQLFKRLNETGRVATAFPIRTRSLVLPGTPAQSAAMVQGGMDFLTLQTSAATPSATVRFAPPSGTFTAALRAQMGIFRLPNP